MIGWLRAHESWMWWLVVISAFTFVISLLAVPWLLVRIPPRYFMSTNHDHPWGDQHPFVHVLLLIGKNLLGLIFIALGIVMLVLPGQGILTILIGVMLLNFPGKRSLERKLISRPSVLGAINRLRARFGKPALVLEERQGPPDTSASGRATRSTKETTDD